MSPARGVVWISHFTPPNSLDSGPYDIEKKIRPAGWPPSNPRVTDQRQSTPQVPLGFRPYSGIIQLSGSRFGEVVLFFF